MFADTNLFLKLTRIVVKRKALNGSSLEMPEIRPWAICDDGFIISIQASYGHYCSPRVNGDDFYRTVELGYPSEFEELILEYAEDPDCPTGSVYANVPVDVVNEVLKKHGGIVDIKDKSLYGAWGFIDATY